MSNKENIVKMDGNSKDVWQEKLAAIKKQFPVILSENKVDCEKLEKLVGKENVAAGERYNFSWAGKSNAIQEIKKRTTATLKPDYKESEDFGNTENIFIEGENLEVLRILQKSYYNKVKMIYIDPPYNTGNDFVYNDKFAETREEYEEKTGDVDEEGKKIRALQKNTKESGHYHSNWLNMMYPRLYLARNLLREDGVIFVSIDDNEVHNLRMIMNEIFGEENFIGDFVVIRAEGGGLAKQVIRGHDYLLVFAKDISVFTPLKRPKDIRGRIIEKDGEKFWLETDWLRKEFGKYGTCMYEDILKYYSKQKKQEIDKGLDEGSYQLVEQKNGKHIVARLRSLRDDGSKFYSVLKHLSAEGVHDLENLILGNQFDFPKPVSLLKQLILGGSFNTRNDGNIILDFFSGSGTTAQAVMELNKEDGGNRKYIMVQMPEKTDEDSEAYKAGYETVADIAKERIRRAAKKIKQEKEEELNFEGNDLDLGFKVFKLSDSNFKTWRRETIDSEKDLQQKLQDYVENLKSNVKKKDMLYELILKLGINPNTDIQDRDDYYLVENGEYVICLEKAIDNKIVQNILEEKPNVVVCLDVSFEGNDELKTNTALQMKAKNIEFKVV